MTDHPGTNLAQEIVQASQPESISSEPVVKQPKYNPIANLKGAGFKKGDPRINRKGRPRSFEKLRDLARQIAIETLPPDPAHPEEPGVSRVEKLLRDWATSKNPIMQQKFLEVAYGKVPDEVAVVGDKKRPITFNVRYEDDIVAELPPGGNPDAEDPTG